MDGRDIGTIVFPNAECKFFLKANVEVRAKRRYTEQLKHGINQTYSMLLKNIISRDMLDTKRVNSPLKKAFYAVSIVVTIMTLDDVHEKILTHIKKIK